MKNENPIIVYVKGCEKDKWLSEIFETEKLKISIFNLDSCPNFKILYKNNSHINTYM